MYICALRNRQRFRQELPRADIYLATLNYTTKAISHQAQAYRAIEIKNTDPDIGWIDDTKPLAFVAKVNDDDTPSFKDAINRSDQAGFRAAMSVKWTHLLEKGTWDIINNEPLE